MSLDGTDCPILEPTPFSKKWYSHKLNGAGIRYEIGLNISTGDIVWAFGGVPCGQYPDLSLARLAYTSSVDDGELTIADDGYQDPEYFIYPKRYPETADQQDRIRARQETVNSRIKSFSVLSVPFRGKGIHRQFHPKCFYAVVNIVQLSIENGEPLFAV